MREIYVACGPPSAGKGPLCALIAETRGIPKIGTGNLLRQEIVKQTKIGKMAEGPMKNGKLVSDDIVCELVANRMKAKDCAKGFVLDGFPRSLSQAERLDALLLESCDLVTAVFELHVDDLSLLEKRILGRWVHPASGREYHVTLAPPKSYKAGDVPTTDNMRDDVTGEPLMRRPDDNADTLRIRLDNYFTITAPILEYYQPVVKQLDATKVIADIAADVLRILESVLSVTDAPRTILVESRNEHIEGTYVRLTTDTYGYPQYRNIDVTSATVRMFLWHDNASQQWHFSRHIGDTPQSPEEDAYGCSMRSMKSANPTTVPLHQLRHANVIRIIPYDPSVVDDVADDRLFIDKDFPPQNKSLQDPHITKDLTVHWIRVDKILHVDKARNPQRTVLFGSTSGAEHPSSSQDVDTDPNAAIQGDLNDCWLIDAFAGMANRQGVIAKQFHGLKGWTLPSDGKIAVQLFDFRVGRFVTVTIDTLIPCVKMNSGWHRALYARLGYSDHPQCWPLLLEKAYAKFVSGYYYGLSGGLSSWAWQASTGINKQWRFERNVIQQKTTWPKFELNIKDQLKFKNLKKLRRATPFTHKKGKDPIYNNEELFRRMEMWDDKGYLMSCYIEDPLGKMEVEKRNGLLKGHAYSILDVVQFDDPNGGTTIRLLQLRNPWGYHEWKGPWSDSSTEWKTHAWIEKKLHHAVEDDGVFFMAFDDWSKEFPFLIVAPSEDSFLAVAERVRPSLAKLDNALWNTRCARVLTLEKDEGAQNKGSRCWGGGGGA